MTQFKTSRARSSVRVAPPRGKTHYEEAFGMDMTVSGRVSFRAGNGPTDSQLVQRRQAYRRLADGTQPTEQRVVRAERLGSNGALITLRLAGSGHRTVFVSPEGMLHECWFDRLAGTRAAVRAHEQVSQWLRSLRQQHVAYPLAMVRAICDEKFT